MAFARIPALAALRAFEAVARQASFTRAAEELRVTQGAISYQVKRLEAELGMALFRREGRSVRLTASGERLLPPLRRALGDIADAVAALSTAGAGPQLTVALSTYFAAHWLSKRLGQFSLQHSDVKIRLQHPESSARFGSDEVDMAIRWHRAGWREPELAIEPLFLSAIMPVCSPRLRDGPPRLARPADIRRHTLLRDEVTREAWSEWLKLAGVVEPLPGREVTINDPNVYIQAAIDGQGIALADGLVADDLALGRLVEPFAPRLEGYGYFLVHPRDASLRPAAKAFRDWLLVEARSDGAEPDSGTSGSSRLPAG
jgi:LysR family transcriptional regulator, glycine cleavage system transcriptional activator